MFCICFFFFKQKTEYEMRISDWISDVCSSDLKGAVIGTVLMLIGQNSRTVAEDVSAKIAQVSKTLPPGVEVKVVLDRAKLVNATVGTVEKNLTEGAVLVAAALFLDRKSTRLNSSH